MKNRAIKIRPLAQFETALLSLLFSLAPVAGDWHDTESCEVPCCAEASDENCCSEDPCCGKDHSFCLDCLTDFPAATTAGSVQINDLLENTQTAAHPMDGSPSLMLSMRPLQSGPAPPDIVESLRHLSTTVLRI